MEEIAVVLKRFGDEQSALLDQFERLSFEGHLNQAILGRSLSEPGAYGSRFLQAPATRKPPRPLEAHVKQGRRPRRSRIDKLLKQLFKPILCTKGTGTGAGKKNVPVPDPKDPKSWKAFSRSLRV